MKKRVRDSGPPAPQREYTVFISHATYDKWIARQICAYLEGAGIGLKTFRDDKDIAGGTNITDAIKAGIRNCDELLLLLTPESITRQWILLEIGMALMWERRIVPILLHVAPEQIPDPLKSTKAYTLDQLDTYLADVAQRSKQS